MLSAAITRVYEEAGWDLALGEPVSHARVRAPHAMGDLQAAAERVVSEIGYGREITDNVRGFISVRLSSLRRGTTGRFFEDGHPIDFGRLMTRNVLFEIEDVGDDRDKAFLMDDVLDPAGRASPDAGPRRWPGRRPRAASSVGVRGSPPAAAPP